MITLDDSSLPCFSQGFSSPDDLEMMNKGTHTWLKCWVGVSLRPIATEAILSSLCSTSVGYWRTVTVFHLYEYHSATEHRWLWVAPMMHAQECRSRAKTKFCNATFYLLLPQLGQWNSSILAWIATVRIGLNFCSSDICWNVPVGRSILWATHS